MSREERKEEERKLKEQERLLSVLPMRKHLLKPFFDFIDDNIEKERNASFRLTEAFAKQHGLDVVKVKKWAEEWDAYNDQEILWNIEEIYEQVMKG
jgi:vacuolar-type H+-ATPase subunit D/Vma8